MIARASGVAAWGAALVLSAGAAAAAFAADEPAAKQAAATTKVSQGSRARSPSKGSWPSGNGMPSRSASTT